MAETKTAPPAKSAKNTSEEIEFDGVLPRWREDDVAFLCHLLRTSYGRKLVTIAQVVRDLGFHHRSDDDRQPRSPEYYRIRRAFQGALAQGLVRRSGRSWGLVAAQLPPQEKK